MPCWNTQSVTVEIGKVDKALLDAAMKELGITDYQLQGTSLTLRGRAATDFEVNEIKVAYSHQVVRATAKRFGWKIQQDGNNYVIQKR